MTKEEAISIISGYEAYGCGYCLQGGDEVEEALRLAVDALKSVRHGRWIKRDDGVVRPFWTSYRCSECLCASGNTSYCPNCGAKMEREEE